MTDNESLTDPFYEDKNGILKVRGKTLIFGNVVYQINNISSIGLVKRTNSIQKIPITKFILVLIIIDVYLFFTPNLHLKVLGVIILVFLVWKVYNFYKNKLRKKYALSIYTNSGQKTFFYSTSEDFIKKSIMVLYNIMNTSDDFNAFTFNFQEASFVDQSQSINIDHNIGSPFLGAQVNGDIVNEV
ncbi:DUF6232 family protein [Moorena sp. SIO3I6]|uniref:DUF6232 family protein n=1 Tax=Moorena sp. SIO3I6 TaxID=2607831 RepID=UPI0013F9F598|nr:DUF6232 family protein [Moorena sp. SIO3I6]NEP22743.1 hypothetical protein [Moorena sp. SIO3I6]